jgi:hypothetical protein
MSLFATGIVRIISEPQLRTFDNGTSVANLFGGIGEGKDKNGEYINNGIDCEIWGKSAELVCDKCKKGDSIQVMALYGVRNGQISKQVINAASTYLALAGLNFCHGLLIIQANLMRSDG